MYYETVHSLFYVLLSYVENIFDVGKRNFCYKLSLPLLHFVCLALRNLPWNTLTHSDCHQNRHLVKYSDVSVLKSVDFISH